mgnify:CR=1 FL=1
MDKQRNKEKLALVNNTSRRALLFLAFISVISLFSDFTHEGARSIYGPYLDALGITAFVVALIAGLGEMIGYGLRIVTGIIIDKTKKYWLAMFFGYSINLLAIPLLAFVTPSIWWVALTLILLERLGKSIRAPAKSVLTSFASEKLGPGKTFAIQEVMDQIGAFLGPLFVFMILSIYGETTLSGYQTAFGYLGIFAVMTLVVLVVARIKYPNPEQLEAKKMGQAPVKAKVFWMYMVAISLIAFGFVDYPLIAFHINKIAILAPVYIPLIYSLAMGIDAISALVFGTLYDKIGIRSLMIAMAMASFASLFVFAFGNIIGVIIGMILWAIGMGAQESVLKSVVASIVAKDSRGRAYGILNALFGVFWFLGSLLIGWLYDRSMIALIVVTLCAQALALTALYLTDREVRNKLT